MKLVVASLKCIAALCSNFDNNASTRDQVLDHKLISNHLKNLLATDSALWVRISRPLAEIVRGSKKVANRSHFNLLLLFPIASFFMIYCYFRRLVKSNTMPWPSSPSSPSLLSSSLSAP